MENKMTTENQVLELGPQPSVALPAIKVPGAVALSRGESFMITLIEKGLDFDKIERAMDLKDRMDAKAAEQAFNEAFASFKAEAIRIVKNKRVADGPLKGKSYAELFSVVDAVTPALSKFGLSTSWKRTKDEKDWIEVTCCLRHSGGHSETVSMGGPPDAGGAKNAIQARQSTESYLRRYTLTSILGVAEGGEDDDGHGGGDAKPEAQQGAIQAGRDAAMLGLTKLTEWWGSLTKDMRTDLQKDYPALRRAAVAADEDYKNGRD